jgi:hypothetical protein
LKVELPQPTGIEHHLVILLVTQIAPSRQNTHIGLRCIDEELWHGPFDAQFEPRGIPDKGNG